MFLMLFIKQWQQVIDLVLMSKEDVQKRRYGQRWHACATNLLELPNEINSDCHRPLSNTSLALYQVVCHVQAILRPVQTERVTH